MKRMTTLWSYLLTLLLAVTVSAAQESSARSLLRSEAPTSLRADKTLSGFGYADRNETKFNYIGTKKDLGSFLSEYIKLPDVGVNKITKISFPANKADAGNSYIIILSEDGNETLYQQKCSIIEGINEIELTKPFVTESGKRYLVGFATKPLGIDDKDFAVLPFDYGSDIEGTSYYASSIVPYPSEDNDTFTLKSPKGLGSACIFVTLEEETRLQTLAYIINVSGTFDPAETGKDITTRFTVRNIGVTDITSFDLTYQFGTGEVKTIPYSLKTKLKSGKTGYYAFDIPAEGDALGAVHFAVAKVNGETNFFANRCLDLPFRIGDTEANAIPRETVLIERFTAEWCTFCPGADPFVNAAVKSLSDAGLRVSYVGHHLDDPFAQPESSQISSYFQGNGIPAMAINRVPQGQTSLLMHPSNFQAAYWTSKLLAEKRGVRIDKIEQTITGDKLQVVVSGVAFQRTFDPENLYLTVILTEDNVAAIKQVNGGANYKHDALPRLFLTDALGDLLSPAADGSFTMTLEGTLDAKWKREQCKVVAFAHDNLKSSLMSRRNVYTAESTYLGVSLANEPVALGQAPVVSAEDGYLSIVGDVDCFELYDMSGALVTTTVGTRLDPGVYVIRIFSNLRAYTFKVIVR